MVNTTINSLVNAYLHRYALASWLVDRTLQLQHPSEMKFKEVHILNERSNYEQSEKVEQSLPSGLIPSREVALRLLRPKNIHIKRLYGDSPKNHIICRRRREKEIDNFSFTCSLPQVELESCWLSCAVRSHGSSCCWWSSWVSFWIELLLIVSQFLSEIFSLLLL